MTTNLNTFRNGTAGTANLQSFYLTRTQAKLNDLSVQLTTNRVTTRFSGISVSSDRILNLEAEITRREQYVTNIDGISTRIQVQDNALDKIQTLVKNFRDLLLNTSNQANPPKINQLATDTIKQIGDYLNIQDGTRFVFAGTNGTQSTPPVDVSFLLYQTTDSLAASTGDLPNLGLTTDPSNDLTDIRNPQAYRTNSAIGIDAYAAGGALADKNNRANGQVVGAAIANSNTASSTTLNGNPINVFSGHYYQLGTAAADRRYNETRQTFQAADNVRIDVGINADEVGFQRALKAISFFARIDPSLPDISTQISTESVQAAAADLRQALTDISESRGRVSSQLQQLNRIRDDQKSFSNLAQGSRDSILLPDTSTVAVLLGNYSNQLQASYSAIATIRNLTLTNYLR